MKRVWTARSLAAVLGGSLLYFLITVLVMMCGSFSPLFWVFLPAITAAASGWLYLYLAARTPRFGVPVLMNLVVLLLFLAAGELSGWMAVTLAAGAVLAELVRRLGGSRHRRMAWEPALETRSGPNPYQKSMSRIGIRRKGSAE